MQPWHLPHSEAGSCFLSLALEGIGSFANKCRGCDAAWVRKARQLLVPGSTYTITLRGHVTVPPLWSSHAVRKPKLAHVERPYKETLKLRDDEEMAGQPPAAPALSLQHFSSRSYCLKTQWAKTTQPRLSWIPDFPRQGDTEFYLKWLSLGMVYFTAIFTRTENILHIKSP